MNKFINAIFTIIKYYEKDFINLPISEQMAIILYKDFIESNKFKFLSQEFKFDELRDKAFELDEIYSAISMNLNYKDGTENKNTIYGCLFQLLLAQNDEINEKLEALVEEEQNV